MAYELLEHYFSYWVFSILHLGIVLIAVRTFVQGRRTIRQHLWKLAPGPAIDARDADLAGAIQAVEARPAPAGTGSWAWLERMHAAAKRPPFAEVRDHYSTLIGGYSEDLSRFVNVLLLTGVAGTLYGLYSSATHADAAASWAASLAASFDAFGVTIAAVLLAGVVIVLQRSMARFSDDAEVSIAALWSPPEVFDPRDPAEAATAVVQALGKLTAQFEPVVKRMEQHSNRILSDSENLHAIAAGCTQIALVARQSREEHIAGLTHVQATLEQEFVEIRKNNHDAFRSIVEDIANFSARLRGLDRGAETVIGAFEKRLTDMLSTYAATLESRLSALSSAAPGVEQRLQRLLPSAAVAETSLRGVETVARDSIEHVQAAVKGLGDAVGALHVRLDRLASAQEAIAVPPRDAAATRPPGVGPRAIVVALMAVGSFGVLVEWVLGRAVG